MSTVKVQINHTKSLSKEVLASHLYNEIGEEYGLDEYYFEDYIDVVNVYQIPNGNFISIFILDFPEIELRDLEPKDVVKSYLDTLKSLEEVNSIVKLQDDFLQEIANTFFNKLFVIEMELRNVLTYILTYDEKPIDKDIFKDFDGRLAEAFDNKIVSENYENGLYYILFNHYASFGEPKKLKADQISEILQEVSLTDFQEFKNRLQRRYISENRHIDFLFSIKSKLKPLEEMRNAVMHTRNLSNTKMANFEKAVTDFDIDDKGIPSLITAFWNNENDTLKEQTWLALAENEITKYKLRQEGSIWFIDIIISDTAILTDDEEEYENLEAVKSYIYEELKYNIVVSNFSPDCKEQIDNWIDEKLQVE